MNKSDLFEFNLNLGLTCITCLPLFILLFTHFSTQAQQLSAPNVVCHQVCSTRVNLNPQIEDRDVKWERMTMEVSREKAVRIKMLQVPQFSIA